MVKPSDILISFIDIKEFTLEGIPMNVPKVMKPSERTHTGETVMMLKNMH